jgi:hypothetical protein
MTSEELDKAIEFLIKQSADFWAGMEELKGEDKELRRGIEELKEQTARLETWAAEGVALKSRPLGEHDKELEEQKRLNRDVLQRVDYIIDQVDFIIDRLFPSKD